MGIVRNGYEYLTKEEAYCISDEDVEACKQFTGLDPIPSLREGVELEFCPSPDADKVSYHYKRKIL